MTFSITKHTPRHTHTCCKQTYRTIHLRLPSDLHPHSASLEQDVFTGMQSDLWPPHCRSVRCPQRKPSGLLRMSAKWRCECDQINVSITQSAVCCWWWNSPRGQTKAIHSESISTGVCWERLWLWIFQSSFSATTCQADMKFGWVPFFFQSTSPLESDLHF